MHRNSSWLSSPSIWLSPLPSSHNARSPVHSSRPYVLGRPASKVMWSGANSYSPPSKSPHLPLYSIACLEENENVAPSINSLFAPSTHDPPPPTTTPPPPPPPPQQPRYSLPLSIAFTLPGTACRNCTPHSCGTPFSHPANSFSAATFHLLTQHDPASPSIAQMIQHDPSSPSLSRYCVSLPGYLTTSLSRRALSLALLTSSPPSAHRTHLPSLPLPPGRPSPSRPLFTIPSPTLPSRTLPLSPPLTAVLTCSSPPPSPRHRSSSPLPPPFPPPRTTSPSNPFSLSFPELPPSPPLSLSLARAHWSPFPPIPPLFSLTSTHLDALKPTEVEVQLLIQPHRRVQLLLLHHSLEQRGSDPPAVAVVRLHRDAQRPQSKPFRGTTLY